MHAGYHALNSLRIEKAYRHFGHDITDEDTPWEAGLGFAREARQAGRLHRPRGAPRQREAGLPKRLVQFKLQSPEPLLYHNEPIWRGDAIVGYIRSGMYAHTLGAAVGLGYVTDAGQGLDPDAYRSRSPACGMPPSPRCARFMTPNKSASAARADAFHRR